MPYADPAKRDAHRRQRYYARRAAALAPYPHAWEPVDMLLAVWCVQLRAELPALDALWKETVTAWIEPSWEERDNRAAAWGPATRVMGSLDGKVFQVCEMEGTDVLADLQDQELEFRWAVVYQATHSKIARRPICPCCIDQEGTPKTEQSAAVGAKQSRNVHLQEDCYALNWLDLAANRGEQR